MGEVVATVVHLAEMRPGDRVKLPLGTDSWFGPVTVVQASQPFPRPAERMHDWLIEYEPRDSNDGDRRGALLIVPGTDARRGARRLEMS